MLLLPPIPIQIPELPPLVEFRLIRLPQTETRRRYGSWGDGESHLNETEPDAVPEWHCNMTIEKNCPTCGKTEPLFFPRGHGFTASEAIGKALSQYLFWVKETEGKH
jgi:hypothetical protein